MNPVFEPSSPAQFDMLTALRREDTAWFIEAWTKAGQPLYLEPGTEGSHRTWLGWAAHAGQNRAVQALLKAGANPNERDGTPLNLDPGRYHDLPEASRFAAPLILALGGDHYMGPKEARHRVACCRALMKAGAADAPQPHGLFTFRWHVMHLRGMCFLERWLETEGLTGLGTSEEALKAAVGADSFSACFALTSFLGRKLTRPEQKDLDHAVLLMAAEMAKPDAMRAVHVPHNSDEAWTALARCLQKVCERAERSVRERQQPYRPDASTRAAPVERPTPAMLGRWNYEQHRNNLRNVLKCATQLSQDCLQPGDAARKKVLACLLSAPQSFCRHERDRILDFIGPPAAAECSDWLQWVELLSKNGEPEDLTVLTRLSVDLNSESSPGTTVGAALLQQLHWLQWDKDQGQGWLGALETAGIDMGETRHEGSPLFHAAAIHGSEAVVAWALRCGADVNRPDAQGDSPLAAVLRRGTRPEMVRFLERAGADWQWRDAQGNTLLHVFRPSPWPTNDFFHTVFGEEHAWLLQARNHAGHTPLDAECLRLAEAAQRGSDRNNYTKSLLLLSHNTPLTADDCVLGQAFPPGSIGSQERILLERAKWSRDCVPAPGETRRMRL